MGTLRKSKLRAMALLSALSVSSVCTAQSLTVPLALSGEPAGGGGTWLRFGIPQLNDSGTISLWGQLATGQAPDVPGTVNYVGRPNSWVLAAASNDPIANRPYTWLGSLFSTVSIAENGCMAVSGTVSGLGLPSNAIGVFRLGELREPKLVTYSGAAVFENPAEYPQYLRLGRDSGTIYFESAFGSEWSGWRQVGDETPRKFIFRNQPLPEVGQDWQVTGYVPNGLNNGPIAHGQEVAGAVWVSQVRATNARTGQTRTVLIGDSAVGRQVVLQTGQAAPGLGPEWKIGDTQRFTANADTLAVIASVRSEITEKQALYRWRDDGFDLLAMTGDPAPGTSTTFSRLGERFGWASSVARDGDIIFGADLAGQPSSNGPDGLWRTRAGQLELVVACNAAAPGVAGSTLRLLANASVNSNDVCAFIAWMEGDNRGKGLWVESEPNSFLPLVVENTLFEVGPGDFRTVRSFDGDTAINEAGEIAFVARFTDGTEGVFLGRASGPVALPEPRVLWVLGSLTMAFYRRR